jgi:DNA-binding cell septation regulator SpoVG
VKIDISNDLNGDLRRQSFMTHFVLEVVGPLFEKAKSPTDPPLDVDPSDLDLVVTINGVEVDAVGFVKSTESQMDRMIEMHAQKLVVERFRDILDPLHESVRELEDRFRTTVLEKFPLSRRSKED